MTRTLSTQLVDNVAFSPRITMQTVLLFILILLMFVASFGDLRTRQPDVIISEAPKRTSQSFLVTLFNKDAELYDNYDLKEVHCTIKIIGGDGDQRACEIRSQKIDNKDFTIANKRDLDVKRLHIIGNEQINFLIEHISEKFPNLIFYDVNVANVKNINDKYFETLSNLKFLVLEKNGIETIHENAFKDLSELTALSLATNNIKILNTKIFKSLINLTMLDLDRNHIENLDGNIFENLVKLEGIQLRSNKLTSISANLFANNLKLKIIVLKKNQIQTINSTMFDHLDDLDEIGLSGNVCVDMSYVELANIDKKSKNLPYKDDLKANCA